MTHSKHLITRLIFTGWALNLKPLKIHIRPNLLHSLNCPSFLQFIISQKLRDSSLPPSLLVIRNSHTDSNVSIHDDLPGPARPVAREWWASSCTVMDSNPTQMCYLRVFSSSSSSPKPSCLLQSIMKYWHDWRNPLKFREQSH